MEVKYIINIHKGIYIVFSVIRLRFGFKPYFRIIFGGYIT